MKSIMPKWIAVLGLIAPLASNAMSIIYDVNRSVGSGSVVGTITTDGTTGTIGSANISAFSLLLNDGIDSFTVDSSAGGFINGPGSLIATTTDLSFDFSATGASLEFRTDTFVSPVSTTWNWSLSDATIFNARPETEIIVHFVNDGLGGFTEHFQSTDRAGQVVIATAAAALPEPGTLALTLTGLVGLALTRKRKQGQAASVQLR